MNDQLLIDAEKWLKELGIRTEAKPTNELHVNRDDIIDLGFQPSPGKTAYENFLEELRAGVNSKRLYWAGQNNQWMFLKAF